jgi:hypothetical protein
VVPNLATNATERVIAAWIVIRRAAFTTSSLDSATAHDVMAQFKTAQDPRMTT